MKRLLRQKANFVILEGFLSELLFEKITIREILESQGNKEDEDDKYNIVDILVKNSKGELVLIEVQNEKQDDYFHSINYGQGKDYIYVGNTIFKGMYEEDILQLSEKQKSFFSKKNISDIYTTYYLIKDKIIQELMDKLNKKE